MNVKCFNDEIEAMKKSKASEFALVCAKMTLTENDFHYFTKTPCFFDVEKDLSRCLTECAAVFQKEENAENLLWGTENLTDDEIDVLHDDAKYAKIFAKLMQQKRDRLILGLSLHPYSKDSPEKICEKARHLMESTDQANRYAQGDFSPYNSHLTAITSQYRKLQEFMLEEKNQ